MKLKFDFNTYGKIGFKQGGFNNEGQIYVILPKSKSYVRMDENLLGKINQYVRIF